MRSAAAFDPTAESARRSMIQRLVIEGLSCVREALFTRVLALERLEESRLALVGALLLEGGLPLSCSRSGDWNAPPLRPPIGVRVPFAPTRDFSGVRGPCVRVACSADMPTNNTRGEDTE